MIETDFIEPLGADQHFQIDALSVFQRMCKYKYPYHFDWQERPII